MAKIRANRALEALLAQPDGSWSLAEGALAVARIGGREVDEAACLAELDRLGRRARRAMGTARHPRFLAGGLARLLFTEEGFAGPEDPAPEHWLIDVALAGRQAGPSLLGVILIEVGRRSGVRLAPVGLPDRLLLRLGREEQARFFDPESGLEEWSREAIGRWIETRSGGHDTFREGHLREITATQALARLVWDIKIHAWTHRELDLALEAAEMMLTIRPDDPREIADRGRILFALGRYEEAIGQFEAFLSCCPRGEEAEGMRELILDARRRLQR
ncbi:MAG: tetratricopeptide repeat protein [Acidobacteriota bacterium]|nr:tetratricopeptide repeat protein [Acidobacteriota bacterium]